MNSEINSRPKMQSCWFVPYWISTEKNDSVMWWTYLRRPREEGSKALGSYLLVMWSVQQWVGHTKVELLSFLLDASINIFITSTSNTAREERDFFFFWVVVNKPEIHQWLYFESISSSILAMWPGANISRCQLHYRGDFFAPCNELAGSTCQNQRDQWWWYDALGLALLYRKPYITLQFQFSLIYLLWPGFFYFAVCAVSTLVCATAAVTH